MGHDGLQDDPYSHKLKSLPLLQMFPGGQATPTGNRKLKNSLAMHAMLATRQVLRHAIRKLNTHCSLSLWPLFIKLDKFSFDARCTETYMPIVLITALRKGAQCPLRFQGMR